MANNKYVKMQKYVSYDGGQSWTPVIPAEYFKGVMLEAESPDCGAQTIEWVEVPGFICDNDQMLSRWVTASGQTVCNGTDLYEVEKKQVSEDSGTTWTDTGETRQGQLIMRDSKICGGSTGEYYERWVEVEDDYMCGSEAETPTGQNRWVDTTGYICQNKDKYKKEKQQWSEDGTTWTDTGVERTGELIETNSADCSFNVSYRWIVDLGYICVGEDKHQREKRQVSTDGGVTWSDTGETRAGERIIANSSDCGGTQDVTIINKSVLRYLDERGISYTILYTTGQHIISSSITGNFLGIVWYSGSKPTYFDNHTSNLWELTTRTGNGYVEGVCAEKYQANHQDYMMQLIRIDSDIDFSSLVYDPSGELPYTVKGHYQIFSRFDDSWTGKSYVSGDTHLWDKTDTTWCEVEAETQYRWVNVDGEYVCEGFDKYQKEKRQKSVDTGETWTDTGETRAGLLIKTNSADCGYTGVQYKWVYTGNDVCDGTTLYAEEKKQKSTDGGRTWEDTGETRTETVREYNSEQCGDYKAYVQLSNGTHVVIPYTDGKYKKNIIYEGEIAEWVSNTGLITEIIYKNITAVGHNAMNGLNSLHTITLPDTLKQISNGGDSGMPALVDVYCYATTPPGAADLKLFPDSPNLANIYVPADSVDAYHQANGWKRNGITVKAMP